METTYVYIYNINLHKLTNNALDRFVAMWHCVYPISLVKQSTGCHWSPLTFKKEGASCSRPRETVLEMEWIHKITKSRAVDVRFVILTTTQNGGHPPDSHFHFQHLQVNSPFFQSNAWNNHSVARSSPSRPARRSAPISPASAWPRPLPRAVEANPPHSRWCHSWPPPALSARASGQQWVIWKRNIAFDRKIIKPNGGFSRANC